ncbi:ATP-binding protein [Bradyrhizobium genosp. A]|uniref:ATP-binding protein n=1 Tax=Bradyrhizobium genosp. A TaxID=83626 RepID=UPI003CF4B3A6
MLRLRAATPFKPLAGSRRWDHCANWPASTTVPALLRRPRCNALLPNTKPRSEGVSDGAHKEKAARSTNRSARGHVDAVAALDRPDNLLDDAARKLAGTRDVAPGARARDREQRSSPHRDGTETRTLPDCKGACGFEVEAQPSIDPKQIRVRAAPRWIANGENVLLLDPPGVGRRHSAERRSWPVTVCSPPRRRCRCGASVLPVNQLPLTGVILITRKSGLIKPSAAHGPPVAPRLPSVPSAA